MNPLVSVVIPAFNAEKYIVECMESICRQTYPFLELLVIDDASTDGTCEILKQIHDPRISIIRNPINRGLAASVNQAIRIAKGNYIARMDADDIALPSRIEKQVHFLETRPEVSIVGTAMKSIGYGSFIHRFPLSHDACKAQLLFNVCFGHPTVMIRKNVFDSPENFYLEELQQYSEEYELWCRLVNRFRFANLPEVLLHYRTFPPSLKSEAEQKRKINSFAIRQNFIRQELGVPASSVFELHDQAANVLKVSTQEEVNKTIEWLMYLKMRNQETHAFHPDALDYELSKRVFEWRYHNRHLGVSNLWAWYQQRILNGYSPRLSQQIKFIGRTLTGM
jgi:glycosyltransferase involved in cell wall biosynthesis